MRGELGSALAQRMRERKMFQHEAAVELGTTQQTLSKWMNGIHNPSDAHVPALATFLGVSEDAVRELIPARDRSERLTAGRRLSDLEDRVDRIAMRVGTLAERLESLAGRLDALSRPD